MTDINTALDENGLDIVERLRGKIRVPITDGLGPVVEGGSPDFFERAFPQSKLAIWAADYIEKLRAELKATQVYKHNEITCACGDTFTADAKCVNCLMADDVQAALIPSDRAAALGDLTPYFDRVTIDRLGIYKLGELVWARQNTIKAALMQGGVEYFLPADRVSAQEDLIKDDLFYPLSMKTPFPTNAQTKMAWQFLKKHNGVVLESLRARPVYFLKIPDGLEEIPADRAAALDAIKVAKAYLEHLVQEMPFPNKIQSMTVSTMINEAFPALEAALMQGGVAQWRTDFENAPNDGSEILVFDGCRRYIAHWGLFYETPSWIGFGSIKLNPTHWAHLIAAPRPPREGE